TSETALYCAREPAACRTVLDASRPRAAALPACRLRNPSLWSAVAASRDRGAGVARGVPDPPALPGESARSLMRLGRAIRRHREESVLARARDDDSPRR